VPDWVCGVFGRGDNTLGQRVARCDGDLFVHQVELGYELCDAMLHLESGIDLQKPEVALRCEQELCRGSVTQTNRRRDFDAKLVQLLPLLDGEPGRRRFLDQLLVAPLHRAVALADSHDRPMSVAQ